jgi:VWFA-related protein
MMFVKRAVAALSGLGLLAALAVAGQAVRGPDPQQPPQQPPQQHTSVVVNIEVPVRVMRKDAFVDGLTLADFEVYENGVRQPLEAVYLIKNKEVLREEVLPGASPPPPQKVRNYVLYLDLKEHLPKIEEAIDYFFSDVLGDKDALFVVTPAKTYKFRSEYLARVPRAKVAERLKDILRADVMLGNSRYRSLMVDFYKLEDEEFPPEMADVKENLLFEQAKEIRDLTELTEERVMAFADILKALDGEKHVFLIFQREVLPAHIFADDRQAELVKAVGFDVDKIKRHFADASITVHCLYITKRPTFAMRDMLQRGSAAVTQIQDLSSDVYASFRQMAAATGGLSESTTNPSFALKQAAEASGNYYLLYYRPLDYKADNRFQEIVVKVRGEGLKVTHRLGYIAD